MELYVSSVWGRSSFGVADCLFHPLQIGFQGHGNGSNASKSKATKRSVALRASRHIWLIGIMATMPEGHENGRAGAKLGNLDEDGNAVDLLSVRKGVNGRLTELKTFDWDALQSGLKEESKRKKKLQPTRR